MIIKPVFVFFLVIASLCVIRFPAQSQDLSDDLRIRQYLNRIEVEYDLRATEPGLQFRVTPYYIDGAGNRIRIYKVTGDIGAEVSAGIKKTFVWNFARELDEYADIMKIAIQKDTLHPKSAIALRKDKYRKTAKMRMELSNPGNTPRYEIIDSTRQIIEHGPLVKKQKKWQLTVPKTLSRDEIYRVRVWNSQEKPFYTTNFSVRRRIPLSWPIVGTALVAGGIWYLLSIDQPKELPSPFELPD